jgi:hypothetical protein
MGKHSLNGNHCQIPFDWAEYLCHFYQKQLSAISFQVSGKKWGKSVIFFC